MACLLTSDAAWVVRRLPTCVRNLLMSSGARVFLAGGFIRSCITNDPVADVDLFVPTKETASNIAHALASLVRDRVRETANAYTVKVDELPVQFIHRWTFDDPKSCVESFDFTIAAAAVWYDPAANGWATYCDENYYADLAGRRLVYRAPIRNEESGGSLLRVLKFYQRGYRITLPSLGAVVARLAMGFEWEQLEAFEGRELERELADVATGLLVEVDPNAVLGDERRAYEHVQPAGE